MSKLVITGFVGIVALGALAALPQISTAAATASFNAPAPAMDTVKPAPRPSVFSGFSPGSYFASAFGANAQATYRTCFMKRSVTYTAQGPKSVATRTCTE